MNRFILLVAVVLTLSIFSCKQNAPTQNANNDVVNDATKWLHDKELWRKTDSVMALMTLEEKIGQTVLYTSDWDVTGPVVKSNYKEEIEKGRVGALFNAFTPDFVRDIQRVAVEKTRLHIPLLFGYDVIHGHRTIFPIPIGESCSWDLQLIEQAAKIAAAEAAAEGINWTFAPMVDIARDPRWGRVAEGAGEDTYLGSLIAQARVRGFQGNDLSDTLSVVSCVKHFAAYGGAIAGRDYNTVDMSERSLFSDYLPPYKAALDAGAGTVMTSFNDLNGIPSTANKWLLTSLLRDQWNFKGFVVTDYTSINELVPHGIAADNEHAAELAINAGVDMDMQGSCYADFLKKLLDNKKVTEAQIHEAARRIIYIKFSLGLFDDPYKYCNTERQKQVVMSPANLDAARNIAAASCVLLKNDKNILPLAATTKKIAVIGELADSKDVMLGCWRAAGDANKAVSLLEGLKQQFPNTAFEYALGCKATENDQSGFAQAVKAASQSDVVIVALGEPANLAGEASCRTNIGLPGAQTALLQALYKTGKPIVVVLLNGRPLALEAEYNMCQAMLEAWHPGTMGGAAIADLLSGKKVPSGKLCMTFPRNLGQVPIYYNAKNTGRPMDVNNHYTSKYLDSPNDPLFPFGFGLSYTTFEYAAPVLSSDKITNTDVLTVTVEVKNTGATTASEVVQLYIQDVTASATRPVKELKHFEKITIEAGQTKQVTFKISNADLSFYRADMTWGSEAGKFVVYTGTNSRDVQQASFMLQ